MRITVHLAIFILCLSLVACVSKSGVQQVGDNHFVLSVRGGMQASGSIVKTELLREANDYCAKSAKKVSVISSSHQDASRVAPTSAEVQFSCE